MREERGVMSLETGHTEVLFCFKGRIRWLRRKRKEEGEKVARCYSWGPFNVFQRHRLKVRLSFWFFSAVLTLCLWMWLWTGWAKMSHGIYSYNLPPYFQENMPKPSIFHQKYHWSGSYISRGSWLPTVVVFKLFPRPPWVPKRHLGANKQISGVGGGVWISRALHPPSHTQRELFYFVFYTAFRLKFNLNNFSFNYFKIFWIFLYKIYRNRYLIYVNI